MVKGGGTRVISAGVEYPEGKQTKHPMQSAWTLIVRAIQRDF